VTSLPDIACAIDIDAPVERVWTVLTEQGLVEHWLGCIGFRPQVGATFYMQSDPAKRAASDVSGATHCEVEDVTPPDRLRFSWFLPGTPKTWVTIELAETSGGTVARLTHSGWDQFDADQIKAVRHMLEGGWRSAVLPGLKRVAEAGA
jgi:uncharacterized protein YndB with AHSA1/START domain